MFSVSVEDQVNVFEILNIADTYFFKGKEKKKQKEQKILAKDRCY